MMIQLKRAWEPRQKSDGFRILVDRLWPRGMSKTELHADRWLSAIAPSNELRKWFNHDPEKWKEFIKKYKEELKGSEAMKEMRSLIKEHDLITMVYAAKDEAHNNAVALKAMLEKTS